MKFYKYPLSIILVMILLVVSLSVVSATEDGNSTDLQTTNDNTNTITIKGTIDYSQNIVENTNDNNIINDRIFTDKDIINDPNFNIYSCNISCENDFKDLSNYLESSKQKYQLITLNITNDINITRYKVLDINYITSLFIINGNDHTIKFLKPKDAVKNHFLTVGENSKVFIENLILSGFNTAIINNGHLELERVIFTSNFQKNGYGGAIYNKGVLNCVNCSFLNNTAISGGGIYSNGTSSTLSLSDCFFISNGACYKCSGKDVYVGGGGTVYSYALNPKTIFNNYGLLSSELSSHVLSSTLLNKIDIGHDNNPLSYTIVLRNSILPVVREYVISNEDDLKKMVNEISLAGTSVDKFVVNFTSTVNFKP